MDIISLLAKYLGFQNQTPLTNPQPSATPDPFVAKGATKVGPNHYVLPPEPPRNTPSPMASAIPQGYTTPTDSPIPAEIRQLADPIIAKYGIPPQIFYGQFAQEGRGRHKYAQDPFNNPFNIGAFDSNPDNAVRYPSLEKGLEAYAKLLSGNYELGYIGSGKFDRKYTPAYELRNDPMEMLKKIKEIGYASDPNYINNITNTPEWRYYNQ